MPPGCRLMPYFALGLVLHRLRHRLQAVPVGRRRGDPGLRGQVLAVVDQPRLDVPGHAVAGVADLGGLVRALEEARGVDPRRRRVERAEVGELAHPGGADHRGVRQRLGGDRGGELVVRGVPRDRGDLHLDAGVGLFEGGGQLGQVLALGAHRPDGDLTGGRAVADLGRLLGCRIGGFLGPAAAGQRQRCRGECRAADHQSAPSGGLGEHRCFSSTGSTWVVLSVFPPAPCHSCPAGPAALPVRRSAPGCVPR